MDPINGKISDLLWLECRNRLSTSSLYFLIIFFSGGWIQPLAAQNYELVSVTNVLQLQAAVLSNGWAECSVSLRTVVCAASRPEVGEIVVSDKTGVEVVQLDACSTRVAPGDTVLIESARCWLRMRDSGVEISTIPLVDNDGWHRAVEKRGSIELAAGPHPFQLDWFNVDFEPVLDFTCEGPHISRGKVPASLLWHEDGSSSRQKLPGLRMDVYEGIWKTVPNFNALEALKTVAVTNIGLEQCPRRDRVGLRFEGCFLAPQSGTYTFRLLSANGAVLFIGDSEVSVVVCGHAQPPVPTLAFGGQIMSQRKVGQWLAVDGRVSFFNRTGRGVDLDLSDDYGKLEVEVADATGFDAGKLFHARIRARGIGRGVLTLQDKLILGRLLVASSSDLEILEAPPSSSSLPDLITSAEQVQLLRPKDAARGLPVRIRGVLTSDFFGTCTLQDDTRGVYVELQGMTNKVSPHTGGLWEIGGHTQAGDFAPTILAETLKFLGSGRMPEPVHPTWNQLINGSMDIQWVELQGVVTEVTSNRVSLLMPEGILQVWFEVQNQNLLKPCLNCYVSIRGVLFAAWDVKTHEVNPGQIFLRNTRININRPAPADVFEAPLKRTSDLRHFDLEAAFFQRIKLRGVVIYAGKRLLFLDDGGVGLRVSPVQSALFYPGDVVEAAGYPQIGGTSPALREAVVRKLGVESMPAARIIIGPEDLAGPDLDATRVQMEALLLNRRVEQGDVVFEMQAGLRPFLARLQGNETVLPSLRTGSLLQLTGVYASLQPLAGPGHGLDSFELLLNGPGAVKILNQPPWWTLKRSLAAMGALSLLLAMVALWVSQLRRQVSLQTRIIREKAEREATLEERTRIARELHDTLEQSLAGVSLQLRALTDSLRDPPAKSGEILKVARQMVRHGQDEARRTVRNLRTLALENGGLSGALTSLVRETSSRFPVKIEFGVVGVTVPLASKVENHLLRVSQEAVTNALKHGQAAHIQISLHFEASAVRLEVRDDGCGFDAAHAAPSSAGHFGLLGMRERVEKINGVLKISSAPGSGTMVMVSVPLRAAALDAKQGHEEEN